MAVYTQIDNPELYFQVKLYTGNGSTQSITFDGDEDMQPDLVWLKGRNHAEGHFLSDSVRGVNSQLYANQNLAQGTSTTVVTAFGSDGFNIGNYSDINTSSKTYVAWGWKESATAGFDIVAYTGDGSAGNTEAHSLSAVPHVMIIKQRNGTGDWIVYHHKNTSAPETDHLVLHNTAATSDALNKLNDVAPTSSIFTLGDGGDTNGSSDTYINYLFTEKQGFSKFGSYTGNGNADGPFIYTGFRPAMIIIKQTNATNRWVISDNKRDSDNPVVGELNPNDTAVEDTSSTPFDFLSNGFKLRRTGDVFNTSGYSYIYMAFAEAPFVNSNGVPCNAR